MVKGLLQLVGDICNEYRNVILAGGDFDMPNILWDLVEETTSANEIAFIELLNYLSQLNSRATREHCVLDLILTTVANLVNFYDTLTPKESEIFTDNITLLFDILLSPKSLSKISRRVYDYRRGDFKALRSSLLYLCYIKFDIR